MSPNRAGALRARVGGPILESGIREELCAAGTLSRGEAVDMVWEAHGDPLPRLAFLKLRGHWAASERDVPSGCEVTELAEWLTEYVDGGCVSGDVR